jgi:hypothetical protein
MLDVVCLKLAELVLSQAEPVEQLSLAEQLSLTSAQ